MSNSKDNSESLDSDDYIYMMDNEHIQKVLNESDTKKYQNVNTREKDDSESRDDYTWYLDNEQYQKIETRFF